MSNQAHDVLWRRLKYVLSPQFDIYRSFRGRFKGRSVLSVGFGTGAGILQYAVGAREVDALEIDPGAVYFANSTFPLENVNWILDDITTYKTHKHYDVVIAVETMEHIPDWEDALENIASLLNEGGEFYMTARNKNADLRRWKELHERELTALQLYDTLAGYFWPVSLYDYSLEEPQSLDTHLTPLIAIARKSL